LAIQFHYRLGIQAVVGGLYTLSRSWGTDDVPSVVQEPASSAAFAYREYFDPAWAAPGGDLSDDRRHRLKFWGHMNVFENESRGTLGVGLLQSIESGQPYGLVSLIDAAPFVVNPGYRQAPLAVPYYFTARDHFSSKSAIRTDVAATYTRILPGTVRTTLVVEFEVLNVFDKERLLRPETYVVARTAYTEPSRFAPFNPLADAPVQGVHWDLESLADPSDDDAGMTMPRAFRVSAGVRF
jgi:hypothetical protein